MPPVDLHHVLVQHQAKLLSGLEASRAIFENAEAKGDATEFQWREVIEKFLPTRYQATAAFVLDAEGKRSEFIDVVIHDRHYCPLLFEEGGQKLIPAESVYAVFEIKQTLNRGHVLYASEKGASVRRLHRTSVPFINSGAPQAARPLFQILTGILALENDWSEPFGDSFIEALKAGRQEHVGLDLGCALRHGAFEVDWESDEPQLAISAPEASLMFFLMRLFGRLQQLGTVPAIDLAEYARPLEAD